MKGGERRTERDVRTTEGGRCGVNTEGGRRWERRGAGEEEASSARSLADMAPRFEGGREAEQRAPGGRRRLERVAAQTCGWSRPG
eukprot:362912-Rhodomonas_salina.1